MQASVVLPHPPSGKEAPVPACLCSDPAQLEPLCEQSTGGSKRKDLKMEMSAVAMTPMCWKCWKHSIIQAVIDNV